MQYTHLGSTGIRVSRLGLGTVKLGRREGVKYPNAFELPDDKTALNLLAQSRDWGIHTLDTAPSYGNSEARLGALLPRVAPRGDWVIIGKAGEQFEQGQSQFDFSAKGLIRSVEQSLSRLKTDYLDVLLLHSDGGEIELQAPERVYPVFEDLKRAGKIRAYGISSKTKAGGELGLQYADVVMMTYHMGYEAEASLIDQAQAKNKGILVKKALQSGHLVDKTQALTWVLAKQGISSVIVGSINLEHMKANLACVK